MWIIHKVIIASNFDGKQYFLYKHAFSWVETIVSVSVCLIRR